jgi:hypothetical protein
MKPTEKTEWKPFPVGTIRGPYHDRNQSQFLVNGRNGWVPFIRTGANAEQEARSAAESFLKSLSLSSS